MSNLTPITMPNVGKFRFWLANSKPGHTFVYHLGNLMADRIYAVVAGRGPGQEELKRIATVDGIAREAWRAYRRGEVVLTQKRLGEGYYAYVARRVRRVRQENRRAA